MRPIILHGQIPGAHVQDGFVAQSLVETKVDGNAQTLVLTLVDRRGKRLAISLPIGVAADLAPVLAALVRDLKDGERPSFTKVPKHWAVGSSPYERLVLIRFEDDPPYALAVDDAGELWREVREEAETVTRMGAPARQ